MTHPCPRDGLPCAAICGARGVCRAATTGTTRDPMTDHEHVDGSGEGYCSCGAERCSLPGCDGYCVHPGGWIERSEILELRRPSAEAYLRGIAPAQPGDVLDDLWWKP